MLCSDSYVLEDWMFVCPCSPIWSLHNDVCFLRVLCVLLAVYYRVMHLFYIIPEWSCCLFYQYILNPSSLSIQQCPFHTGSVISAQHCYAEPELTVLKHYNAINQEHLRQYSLESSGLKVKHTVIQI
jgi:hypothetical protein